MRKYGMRYSSIRYWQQQGYDLYAMRGIVTGLSIWVNPNRYMEVTNRDIAHALIGHAGLLARWHSPADVGMILRELFKGAHLK